MHVTSLPLLITALLPLLPSLIIAQDQCNLLPVSIQTFPLYSLVPHTLNKTSTTLCEKYTPSGTSQYDWIVQLINLAFTGAYKPLPNLWPAVPNGTYQATGLLDEDAVYRDPCYTVTKVNLVKYFNGTYRSTNRNGKAVSVNFLDSGSIISLKSNIPAWSAQSNQYRLLTSFYKYFGYLLGCRDPSFPHYTDSNSQTAIHRFMDLSAPEIHYFIHSVYDAAVSLGVAGPDLVTHVGDAISIGIALDNVFNKRCSPAEEIIPGQGKALQSVCADKATCATWAFPNATCDAYNFPAYGVTPALASPGEADGSCGRWNGGGGWGSKRWAP